MGFRNKRFPGPNKRRNVIRIISIHVGDLPVSGSGPFVKYITQRMEEKFDVGRYEGNEETFFGMEILKIKMMSSAEWF